MTPAARISAAIEVLADTETRRRPIADALKDWGLAHRFAGSKDRAAIASLAYDVLRRRSSAAWVMADDTPRARMLGMLRLQRGAGPAEIAALFSGERFAPEPLTETERQRLEGGSVDDAPAHVVGDFPDWIAPSLERVFGADLVAEMGALAIRAPLDLRVNALKSDRESVQAELAHLLPTPTPHAPLGLRLPLAEDGRGPPVQAEPAFLKGHVEIQDEGSQLAALLAGPEQGSQVVDLCAGGGGKTLALAAAMGNHGEIFATDTDLRRLAPIHDRLQRAGVRNVQVRTPRGRQDAVDDLVGRADLVLVDAPCTGTGTWRRSPDAKWRLRPGSLSARVADQVRVLDRAAELARPGGRIVYVTCSILPEENDDAVTALLERQRRLVVVDPAAMLTTAGLRALAESIRLTRHGLQMTPLRTNVDGFYVAVLRREA